MARLIAIFALFATALIAEQGYSGPIPSKTDTPYLVHADRLVETEAQTARQRAGKAQVSYLIAGDKSGVRTPLASPTLVIETAGMDVRKLQLFRLEVKNGVREVTFFSNSRAGAVPLRTEITEISDGLYRIAVVDSLPAGEYGLSPDGTNDVFCFEVF